VSPFLHRKLSDRGLTRQCGKRVKSGIAIFNKYFQLIRDKKSVLPKPQQSKLQYFIFELFSLKTIN